MSEFTLEEVPPATVATMRRTVPMTQLTEFFGTAFTHVADAVKEAGGRIGGAPFAWYHGMPGEAVDISAGFEVYGDVHPTPAGVQIVDRPGGRGAVTVHVGPYDTVQVTWSRLLGWLTEQGLSPRAEVWEEYLDPPEGDPATWRTRIVTLVDD